MCFLMEDRPYLLKGCDFDESFRLSQIYDDDGLAIRTIHVNTLKQSKKAAGRFKDLDDLEKLSGLDLLG